MSDDSQSVQGGTDQRRPLGASLEELELDMPDNPSAKVWRYLTLAKTLSMLQTQELYFRRSDLLQDQHEGAVTRHLSEDIFKNTNIPKGLEHTKETLKYVRMQIRKAIYLNCWCADDMESEALWRLYCPDGHGVAIQTTVQLLQQSLDMEHVKIGKVRYIDYEKDHFPAHNLLYPFFYKRASFAHEKEFRLIFFEGLPNAEGTVIDAILARAPDGRTIELNLDRCIEKIVISPYAPRWFFKTFQRLLADVYPQLSNRLTQSQLSVGPYF